MSINLVTYANQTVTPTNDAIIYERAIDQNGIFYGCNVTVSGNEVHITGGYGMVCGREFTIDSEAIAVTLAPSGTLDGRLYVRLDLADADAPIQLLTATGNTLPPLEQDDDVNYTNGTYEMELATFTVGVSALSDVVETFETIVGSKQVPSVIADYIVEEGTDGDWSYCKWNSGKAECWARWSSGAFAPSSTSAPINFRTLTKTFPTGLFYTAPMAFVDLYWGSGYSWASARSVTESELQFACMKVSNTSESAIFYAHAIGTWK